MSWSLSSTSFINLQASGLEVHYVHTDYISARIVKFAVRKGSMHLIETLKNEKDVSAFRHATDAMGSRYLQARGKLKLPGVPLQIRDPD